MLAEAYQRATLMLLSNTLLSSPNSLDWTTGLTFLPQKIILCSVIKFAYLQCAYYVSTTIVFSYAGKYRESIAVCIVTNVQYE